MLVLVLVILLVLVLVLRWLMVVVTVVFTIYLGCVCVCHCHDTVAVFAAVAQPRIQPLQHHRVSRHGAREAKQIAPIEWYVGSPRPALVAVFAAFLQALVRVGNVFQRRKRGVKCDGCATVC